MASIWTQPNNYKLRTLVERVKLEAGDFVLPVDSDATVTLLAGKLPPGLRLNGVELIGTPFEVEIVKDFKFVLRAKLGETTEDRTFIIEVTGPDEPIWITQSGLLPMGQNETLFVLDNEIIDYQFLAIDADTSAGQVIEYYIVPGEGTLPPGLSLSSTGKIQGVVEPLLALDKEAAKGGFDTSPYDAYPSDFSIKADRGFDSYFYDNVRYDTQSDPQVPKKLNRYYEFKVTINDGVTSNPPKRTFKIYVVGDDYLRADNTIMKVSNGVFKADNTNIRDPKWLTPADLGYKKSNNNATIYLDVYDSGTLQGNLLYSLDEVNNDGSESILPPGLKLDTLSGELTGPIPYQPRSFQDYKFTVRATRYTNDLDYAVVTGTFYEDTFSGKRTFKVFKLPLNVQDGITLNDGIDDLNDLVGQTIVLNGRAYTVEVVDGSDDDFDEITLTETLRPFLSFTVAKDSEANTQSIFVEKLNEFERQQWKDKKLNYDNQSGTPESYTIQSVYGYKRWQIESPTASIGINFEAGGTTALQFESETFSQSIIRIFEGNELPVFVDAGGFEGSVTFWAPDNALTKESRIKQIFTGSDVTHTLLDGNKDIIYLDRPLEPGRSYVTGQTVSLALYADGVFEKELLTYANEDVNNPSKPKTFSIRILGEVDSEIAWITPADLGSITANFNSTKRVTAQTNVPDTRLIYTIVSGRLPNGLRLAYTGEIIGKVTQFGTLEKLGLTTIDNADFSLDGGTTSIDRSYTVKIKAEDRFGYSAVERDFTIDVIDQDDTLYSNLYIRPMLEPNIRKEFKRFVSNPDIFPTTSIYRASDPNFGIQTKVNMLAYAGIETKNIDEYVAATAKNHKRRNYKIGDVKTAVAKDPGSNDIVYEVVYLEVIDPRDSKKGKVANNFSNVPQPNLTADSVALEVKDDVTAQDAGFDIAVVDGRFRDIEVTLDQGQGFTVGTRQGETIQNIDNSDIDVFLRDGSEVNIDVDISDSEPIRARFRNSNQNTVKSDSNAVTINNANELHMYISNTTNMREQLESIGRSQREYLPLWMRTGQDGNISEIDYVTAIPLAYCKEGESKKIQLNVKNALLNGDFDFKTINFDVDRYIVDSASGIQDERYIVFPNYIFNV